MKLLKNYKISMKSNYKNLSKKYHSSNNKYKKNLINPISFLNNLIKKLLFYKKQSSKNKISSTLQKLKLLSLNKAFLKEGKKYSNFKMLPQRNKINLSNIELKYNKWTLHILKWQIKLSKKKRICFNYQEKCTTIN